MVRELSVMSRRAFQEGHFLAVNAGKPQLVGPHQFQPLVDGKLNIKSYIGDGLPEAASVEDLAGAGYGTIPRLFAVRAHGLVDIQRKDGVMHRFAGMCAAIMQRSDEPYATKWRELLGTRMANSFHSISPTDFMEIANSVADAVPGTALSMDVGDGAVHVTRAEIGAQIYIELNSDEPTRGPQNLFTNGMYTFVGDGPLHILGGAEALVVSRSAVSFKEGTHDDWLFDRYKDSGMPKSAIEAMRMHLTQEDSTVIFLPRGEDVHAMPIPNHGIMMRAVEGAVAVWKGDALVEILESDNGKTLLCHPDAKMLRLNANGGEAKILKVPFKLD